MSLANPKDIIIPGTTSVLRKLADEANSRKNSYRTIKRITRAL